MITVRVPATTANLGPGFDCLGMALDLHCRISLDTKASGLRVDAQGEGADLLPRDGTNVVVRAAAHLFAQAGLALPGLAVEITNDIPVARGLGSSAAAIIGGLVAANQLVGRRFSDAELLQMAFRLDRHADNVAAALLGGVVIVAPGDTILYHRLTAPDDLRVIAAVPDLALSTTQARSVLPARVPLEDAVFNLSRVALLTAALCSGNTDLLARAVEDRLHQPYRATLIPGLTDVLTAARQAGALAAAVSGSGSTLIAFTREKGDEIGWAMADAFARHGVKCRILAVTPQAEGALIVD